MFRIRTFALVLAVFALSASVLSAASNVWAHGFPKTVRAGGIMVKGTATADTGFTLGAKGSASVWPAGHKGGVVQSFDVTVDPKTGIWSASLTGLSAEKNYEIVVQVPQTKGTTTQQIATQPKVAENEK
jgi:hypothetical protein